MAVQQLKLFSGQVSQIRDASKRTKKRVFNVPQNVTRWDLWTQESESEKEMAMLFLDIRNFTPLVATHQAFDVIHIVRKMFYNFQNIIRIHHGIIIETSGDGLYAAFGTDRNVKEAVNSAVAAGMAILNSLEQLNRRSFERNLNRRIEVGIGIHVGKVATGNLHLGKKDHLVVMGYAVNIASRIQSATKELNNNLIVSSAVFHLLDNPPASTQVTANLKGVKGSYELHLVGRRYTETCQSDVQLCA